MALLLALPLGFFLLVYIGSLVVLFLNAFWETDPFSGDVIPVFSLDAFVTLFTVDVYRTIALRTIGMAILVTLTCVVAGLPGGLLHRAHRLHRGPSGCWSSRCSCPCGPATW